MRLAVILAAIMCCAPAFAADGWTMRAEKPGCFADRTQADGATVEIGVWPGRMIVGFSRPDQAVAQRSVPVTIRIDDGPAIAAEALGFNHAYVVTVRPLFADALRKASRLEFAIGAETYRLDIANAAAAMDDAGRCAKLKTLPGMAAAKIEPVEGAPGWLVLRSIWATDTCAARRPGREADALIFHTGERGVLAVGLWHDDWMKPTGSFTATVAIDNGPPRQVAVIAGFELAVWKATDDEQRLFKGAHTMTWQVPWGTYTVDITGLPDAAENIFSYWC